MFLDILPVISRVKVNPDPFVSVKTALITIIVYFLSFNIAFAGSIADCQEYSQLGIPGQQGELLCRKGYLLAYSYENKTPLWVIEHLTAAKVNGSIARYNKFLPDPDLNEGDRAELEDYKKSGYDRGHMAPAADMKWDQQAMIECFFLSNMVPQIGRGMNQGIWKNLEEHIRQWAIEGKELYVFTGPIYEDAVKKTIGLNKVAVPTHLYKIVYDPDRAEAIAFIMPNEKLDIRNMQDYIVTIRDIENKTGLDFLSRLDKNAQDVIENRKAIWNFYF